MPQDALTQSPPTPASTPQSGTAGRQPQSFIFARELSEVYLLLDHISGRADKALPTEAATDPIQNVCMIGWPPTGTVVERAAQASTLLHAKDLLNRAALPASGATISFTLLVAGGDDPHPTTTLDENGWGEPPSRVSLAALAYPGLVASAKTFRRWMRWIIAGLAVWLLFTCALSWNIAAGHAILSRLDALAIARADIEAKIAAGDLSDDRDQKSSRDGGVQPYCDRHRAPPLAGQPPTVRSDRFDSIAALRICQPMDQNVLAHRFAYANLADWLKGWEFVKAIPHWRCGGPCLATVPGEVDLTRNATDEQWASILAEVLGSAVLPIFYGILGASAAIVRDLWRKTRDSLLSPRDLTLSLAQLALGAVIGACIGLFVTPSGATAGTPSLTGAVSLSASALSFIAGFGVEGVFVALESFLKRVFGVIEPQTAAMVRPAPPR